MPGISRRNFIAGCAGASVTGALVSLPLTTWNEVLLAADNRPLQADARILVLVTMYGGNDGLNTVIPHTSTAYQDARPDLAYDDSEVLDLDGQYGLNPGMRGMAEMFEAGSLAIVRGVGYPEPDRSHFRSMDIWQSASLDNLVTTGWIGRWLDANGGDPLHALHFGRTVPPLAVGASTSAALFSYDVKPSRGSEQLMSRLAKHHPSDSPAMAMVCDSYRDATQVNRKLSPMFDDGPLSTSLKSESKDLAAQLDAVAACIAADVPTRVYSVAIGGFDTHADERGTQEKLLRTLDKAVTSFMKKISGDKHAKDVVVMAYSEFGRRVAANASDGTDHGTAGPVFVVGDRVRGGFYGDDPSLTDLVDDDLKVTTDFRDVYHEILTRGLGSDPEPVIGKGRKDIGFLKA
ncbi:DUF1501 domain-containing protein [Mycolicibacterium hippocampi]|uniref:DUF1501 domain-containing protein n=1 Tax=Mycolicibacterium hippocampi TaxID=659824 RepID=A0A7I9ZM30_9MYCO|nr:DUF1501 domain-containing protein [Mycolicibacterium hippocampi]GFH01913.1 hypothetical protein MHIP_23960 [Mycolicibacterium hippocampi]